jgi:erythromycin esterase-like protein
MRTEGLNLFDVMGPDRPVGTPAFAARLDVENRRDSLNAENLRWVVDEEFARRKVIVWAHNAHVMNTYFAADWRTTYEDPHSDAMKPMGVFLKSGLKDDVYTIVMTTYGGEDGWPGAPSRTSVSDAPTDSLEDHMHKLGYAFAFVDLRATRRSSRIPTPLVMRLPKYDVNAFDDPSEVVDGIFYIDHMAAANSVQAK